MGIIGPGGGGASAGAWTPVTLGPNSTAGTSQPTEARTENSGATGRLRGSITVGAGTILTGGLILTLPVGIRPAGIVRYAIATTIENEALQLEVKANGEVINSTLNTIAAGKVLSFDFDFNIT